MDITEEISNEVKQYLEDAKGSHDWEHTQRVYNLCMHIGKKENANLEILKLAALLHDIARLKEDKSNGKVCHAEEGSIMAKEILKKYNLDDGIIEQVAHCIKSHRFRGNNLPKTKEAKVLFDADKLDSIGAVGIGRSFLFAGEIGAKLHDKNVNTKKEAAYSKDDTAYREFIVKLQKIKDRMLTNEGKRLAEERHIFMVNFFKRLNDEVNGKI
jgi:uncharacterized protein